MAEKKDTLMAEYLAEPIKIGDVVDIPERLLASYPSQSNYKKSFVVKDVVDDNVIVEYVEYGKKRDVSIKISSVDKSVYNIGANPFCDDKQMLIESVYKRLNCGQILVRNHSHKEVSDAMNAGDTEICFRDVVDGKQRLNTLYEFMTDKFPDRYGNYYSDLSYIAQCKFNDSQAFTFAEMDEESTDEDVIAAFLNVNFTGVPQSNEHIEYVERIAKLMK